MIMCKILLPRFAKNKTPVSVLRQKLRIIKMAEVFKETNDKYP